MQNSIESNKLKMTSTFRNIVIIPFLFIGHLAYELFVGHLLFKLAGGIREYPDGRWTELGGISWAFETPLYAPGSYLMAKSNIGPCMWDGSPWGLLLIIIATTLTAIVTGQLIFKAVNKDNDKFGKYYWRLFIVLLGWVFIPVPVEMTLTYEFTVLC